MKLYKGILIGTIFLFLIIVFINPINGFEIDNLFLKISMIENSSAVNHIKIKNSNSNLEHFSIKVNNLRDLIKLDKEEFDLNPDEEYNFKLTFDIGDKEPGVYLGELEVVSGEESKIIPIILEIQSRDVLFDSNVYLFPKRDIVSGETLNTEIKIFDLGNIGRSNVNLIYSIKDFNERTIVSETETLVIDGKIDYSKTFDLPEDIMLGYYVLIVLIKYEDSIGTSSIYFEIVKEEEELYSIWGNESLFFLLVFFFFFFFLGFMIYILFSRDKSLDELHSQYKREIKRQRESINKKRAGDYFKLKNLVEKREYNKEVGKVKKQRVRAIREIHKKRLKEFRDLKKKKINSEMGKKLKKWKSQGYDTYTLEKKFKLPNAKDIKNKIKKWDSQGYNLGVLEKN